VVGSSEADHAATATDVIESCKLARRSIENAFGAPDMTQDTRIITRSDELAQEAAATMEAIKSLSPDDIDEPLIDPGTLAKSVTSGLLDAPQLKNNPYGKGQIITRIDRRGACIAVDQHTDNPIKEQDRFTSLDLKTVV
jgi:hypothetical protein